MTVKEGSKVSIEYTGTLDDGTVFDSSEKHGKPLQFTAGSGQVIKGFDAAVMGLKKDDSKEITIPPAEAYGDPNPQLQKEIPRTQLPPDFEPKVDMVLGIKLPDGQQAPARIAKVEGEKITIDLNHPLAGKTLHFKIKVVGIE